MKEAELLKREKELDVREAALKIREDELEKKEKELSGGKLTRDQILALPDDEKTIEQLVMSER